MRRKCGACVLYGGRGGRRLWRRFMLPHTRKGGGKHGEMETEEEEEEEEEDSREEEIRRKGSMMA